MAGKESPTLVVLRQILGEQKATNRRLDTTVERLDTTIERLDALERRQSESEIHLATEIVALAKAVGDVKTLLSDRLDLNKPRGSVKAAVLKGKKTTAEMVLEDRR